MKLHTRSKTILAILVLIAILVPAVFRRGLQSPVPRPMVLPDPCSQAPMRYLQPGSVVQAVLKLELKGGCGGFIQLRGAEGHEDEADEWVAVHSAFGKGVNNVQIEEVTADLVRAFERRQIADSARLSLEMHGLLKLLPKSGVDDLASRMLSEIADLIGPDAVLDRLQSSLSRAKRDMQPSTAGSQLVPHQELQNQAREAPIASHELGTDFVYVGQLKRRRRIAAGGVAAR